MQPQPLDNNWYMDIGATSHLMNGLGIDFPYINWHSYDLHIMVGDGTRYQLGVVGLWLYLNLLPLLVLKIMYILLILSKNLVYVRKFTFDNIVFVEFNVFYFSVRNSGQGICRRGEIVSESLPPLVK